MSVQESVKERIPIYDYARVFVAYLVILGHCLPAEDLKLRPYIYAFHVPFFFLVSGMLYKEVGYIPWKKLCQTILCPYIFFNILAFVLAPLLIKLQLIPSGDYSNASYPLIDIYKQYFNYKISPFITGKTMPDGPTWFLLVLFWCKIMMHIVNRKKIFLWICLMLVLAAIQHKVFIYRIGTALMVMPFFIVGSKYKLSLIDKISNRYSLITGLVLFAISIVLTKLNVRTSTYTMVYGHLIKPINIIVFYLNAIIASYGTLLIFKSFKSSKIITMCANALISILCIQRLFYRSFHQWGNRESILSCIIVSVFILVVCVLLHYVIEKYTPIIIGKKKQKPQ